jgi:hypothetical protein
MKPQYRATLPRASLHERRLEVPWLNHCDPIGVGLPLHNDDFRLASRVQPWLQTSAHAKTGPIPKRAWEPGGDAGDSDRVAPEKACSDI